MTRFIKHKRITAILLCIIFLCNLVTPVYAADSKTERAADYKMISAAIDDVSVQLMKKSAQPKPGSVGGEWLILGDKFAALKAEGRVADGMIPKLTNSFKGQPEVPQCETFSDFFSNVA